MPSAQALISLSVITASISLIIIVFTTMLDRLMLLERLGVTITTAGMILGAVNHSDIVASVHGAMISVGINLIALSFILSKK